MQVIKLFNLKLQLVQEALFGKGFLNGSQAYLNFLPEKHTDFIFTLYAEEFGFIGSVSLWFFYTSLITYRIIHNWKRLQEVFLENCIVMVLRTAFFIYVAVNMSMVLGLLPIVGAPLYQFLSYGGSSMLAIMFGLGLVMSCSVYKNNVL